MRLIRKAFCSVILAEVFSPTVHAHELHGQHEHPELLLALAGLVSIALIFAALAWLKSPKK